MYLSFFFFNAPATTEISTLSLHDALPISVAGHLGAGRIRVPRGRRRRRGPRGRDHPATPDHPGLTRSEEHTSELQSHSDLVCRLLLEKKKKQNKTVETRINK